MITGDATSGLEHGQTMRLQQRRGFLRSFLRLILFLCVGLLIYALSLGPAYLALRKHRIQQSTFNRVYDPIVVPALKQRVSCELMFWYLGFWYDDSKEFENGLDTELKANGYTVDRWKPVGNQHTPQHK
jgi:hypothetical protein